jgi:hypothetical protein
MPAPSVHKTIQARVLSSAQEYSWPLAFLEVAERRHGFDC